MNLQKIASASIMSLAGMSAMAGTAVVTSSQGVTTAQTGSTYTLGAVTSNPASLTVQVAPGSFSEFATFVIPQDSSIAGGAQAFQLTFFNFKVLSTENFAFSLFSGVPSGGTLVSGPFASGGSFSTGPLGAGNYYLSFSGLADGINGGVYSGTVQAMLAPIPEPGTYAMMLAGLGIFAFRMRNRRGED